MDDTLVINHSTPKRDKRNKRRLYASKHLPTGAFTNIKKHSLRRKNSKRTKLREVTQRFKGAYASQAEELAEQVVFPQVHQFDGRDHLVLKIKPHKLSEMLHARFGLDLPEACVAISNNEVTKEQVVSRVASMIRQISSLTNEEIKDMSKRLVETECQK